MQGNPEISANGLLSLDFRSFPKFHVPVLRFLLPVILLLAPAPAWAWGAQGHEIVATIAAHQLTPNARTQVARLLGNAAMLIHDSNWADEIRDWRPETGPWHYVDIPLHAPGYVAARDCSSGQCVVTQIARARQLLGDPRRPAAARAEALRFLIHLVADLHQPLHAVDDDDRGGNEIRIYLQGRRTNLHQLWDTGMVEALGRDMGRIAADIERNTSPVRRKAWQAGSPASWADETHTMARDRIYPMVGGRRALRLSPAYMRAEIPATRQQLAKAGIRLAWLLNTTLR